MPSPWGSCSASPATTWAARNLAIRVAVLAAICLVAVWAADLAERLRRSRDQLEAILDNVADGVTAQEPDGRLVFANRAAVDAVGLDSAEAMMEAPREDVVGRFELFDEEGNPMAVDRLPGRRAVRGETPEPTVIRYRDREGGEDRWSVVKATPIRDEAGEVVLAISVIEDVTDRMRAERADRFLSQASKLLAASLDYPTTLRRVAELAVPEIADWCAVDVLDDRGALRHVALAAADERNLPLARELRERYPVDPDSPNGVAQVIRSGNAELHPEIADEMLAGAARDERQLELLRSLHMRSVMVAPMTARGRTLGAITFCPAEPARRFDDGRPRPGRGAGPPGGHRGRQRPALRGSAATSRARCRRACCRRALPDIPGVERGRPLPGRGRGERGGRRLLRPVRRRATAAGRVVIGDVCGKGAGAAALTALARYTLRAAAMRRDSPSEILELSTRRSCASAPTRILHGRLRAAEPTAPAAAGRRWPAAAIRCRSPARGRARRRVGKPGSLLGVMPDPSCTTGAWTSARATRSCSTPTA